jgi:hypothetical protein
VSDTGHGSAPAFPTARDERVSPTNAQTEEASRSLSVVAVDETRRDSGHAVRARRGQHFAEDALGQKEILVRFLQFDSPLKPALGQIPSPPAVEDISVPRLVCNLTELVNVETQDSTGHRACEGRLAGRARAAENEEHLRILAVTSHVWRLTPALAGLCVADRAAKVSAAMLRLG